MGTTYGYLPCRCIQSSRRLERETQCNVELMWPTGRLMPDFKTIADFRKDDGAAIRAVSRQFVILCRRLNLFTEAIVAIDGSKFEAVNSRDKKFTPYKVQKRIEQIEASIAHYLAAIDAADRQENDFACAIMPPGNMPLAMRHSLSPSEMRRPRDAPPKRPIPATRRR